MVDDSLSGAPSEPAVLLGRLAAGLAGGLPLAAGLALLVDGLALRSAVLRRTGPDTTDLLAVAGDVVHAVPAMRPAPAVPLRASTAVDLPVPGPGGRHAVLLTVVGARPSQLPVLSAAAAVLGLALPGAAASALAGEVSALLLDADEDGDALADALHDGPVQTLVAARYACDAAVRGGDPALARDGVQDALVALRRTLWHLRPRGGEGLADALDALSARLVEAGGSPLVLALDTGAASRLPAASGALAYRLVQSVARDADGPVRVSLRPAGEQVRLDVDGGRALHGPDRWLRRLRALGGDLTSSAGRLRLQLPVPAPPRSSPPRPVHPSPADTKACS